MTTGPERYIAARGGTGSHRIYPRARVGDRFGDRRVVAVMSPDLTSNERVEWRCVHEACGRRGVAYVFNLRKQNGPGCGKSCPARVHGPGGNTRGRRTHRELMAARARGEA